MQVVVAYGSKAGGTAEIAHAIAERLSTHGLTVEVSDAAELQDADGFDAIVVGSSLYAGRWRNPCVRYLRRLAKDRYAGPVWLFHSGPLTDEEAHTPQDLPRRVAELAERLDTRDVVTFGGVLDEQVSGVIAKRLAKTMAGDWRDWGDIEAFADGIADDLRASAGRN